MTKYELLTPVMQGGVIVYAGVIELDENQVLRLQELGAIGEEVPEKDERLEDMKLPELKAYAKKRGIDLGEATKSADVLEVILKAGEPNVDGGAS